MRALLAALLCSTLAAHAYAQEVTVATTDTTQSVIAAQKGKRVTLRLRSGQELAGTVRDTTATLVVLGAVAGREFFDAVVPVDAVEAVLVRTRSQ